MLPRHNRLKTSRDFDNVYRNGRHYKGRFGKWIVLDRKDSDPARIGIVISAKRGNAVERNKARRQVREAIRQIEQDPPKKTLPDAASLLACSVDISYILWDINFSFPDMLKEIETLAKISKLI